MNYTRITEFNGTPVAELSAGGYTAVIAYEIGSMEFVCPTIKTESDFFASRRITLPKP